MNQRLNEVRTTEVRVRIVTDNEVSSEAIAKNIKTILDDHYGHVTTVISNIIVQRENTNEEQHKVQ